MKVILDKEEKLKVLEDILCNGLQMLGGSGLELTYDEKDYIYSRGLIDNPKSACYEDILIKMLEQGFVLKVVDMEGEGEYTRDLTWEIFDKGVENVDPYILVSIIEEHSDAIDSFNALQYILYNNVIFG